MYALRFPSDFLWGTATASYQVEGAATEDGRKPSIWDTFCRVPNATHAGENGDIACDQYHRYKEDVALLAELGFKSYRFSIAWPRILPDGTGEVNERGVAYYRSLCEALHAHGIQACATLYHWDLPQCLQDKGGWVDRGICEAFAEFANVCFERLGAYVDQWITINEPFCIAHLGYGNGEHAPGIKDPSLLPAVIHHVNLAHGMVVALYRSTGLTAPIGITWNLNTPRPATGREEDKKAALVSRALETEVFTGPVLHGSYPALVVDELGIRFPVQPGDMELIGRKVDFVGLNYYSEHSVRSDVTAPYGYSFVPSWEGESDMGWPIVPGGLKRQLHWIGKESGGIPLYITENGYAGIDVVDGDGRIRDKERIAYLKRHFAAMHEAMEEGVNLKGYFLWSMLDNFEWTFGYTKRFGMIHVDFKTLKRTPKDSAYFLRDVMANLVEW